MRIAPLASLALPLHPSLVFAFLICVLVQFVVLLHPRHAAAAEGQPMTPVIGVSPDEFDFGNCVLVGTCAEREVEIV